MSVKKAVRCLVSAFAALVMAFAMVTPAFAVQNDDNGTITINDAVPNEEYSIYQIAVLESYDGDAYAYRANGSWEAWLETRTNYVSVDENGYVTWTADTNADTVAEFARSALAYAKTQSGADSVLISPLETKTAVAVEGSDTATVTFNGLNLGWYLVDTSLGSSCMLDTTNKNMEVVEKNGTPTIDKTVKEDYNGNWVKVATVDANNDTVEYKLSVTVGAGVDGDYVITDTLPDGITYNDGSLSFDDIDGSGITPNYVGNKLSFTVPAEKLADVTSFTVKYDASVNGLKVDKSYTNEVELKYSRNTYKSSATVKTFKIDGSASGSMFTKVDGTNENKALPGVMFSLSKIVDGTTNYAKLNNDGYLTGWTDDADEATKLVTDDEGHIYAYGLDAGSYILTETDALPGYNKLDEPISVSIDLDGDVSYQYEGSYGNVGENGDITVVNNAGTILPTTGGMGTTALYAVGAVLVVGAGVTLVVRRRAHHEA